MPQFLRFSLASERFPDLKEEINSDDADGDCNSFLTIIKSESFQVYPPQGACKKSIGEEQRLLSRPSDPQGKNSIVQTELSLIVAIGPNSFSDNDSTSRELEFGTSPHSSNSETINDQSFEFFRDNGSMSEQESPIPAKEIELNPAGAGLSTSTSLSAEGRQLPLHPPIILDLLGRGPWLH